MGKTTTRFEITGRDGRWVVSADGAMILACRRKRMAIEAVRTAERLMLRPPASSWDEADVPDACARSACAAHPICDEAGMASDDAHAVSGPARPIRRAS